MKRLLAALIVAAALAAPAAAQTTGTPADHDGLRQLKTDVVDAINARDYAKTGAVMAKPFMATVLTQDSFVEIDKLKAYFESLFSRTVLGVKSIKMQADADDYATILEGPFAFAKGSTKERYEMKDGRVFDMNGRWTAVATKQDGRWKVAAIHTGVNFLDNPVLGEIEKGASWFGAGGLGLGLLLGGALGWFMGRRRSAKAA